MTTIKFRRDTSANWTTANPIPAQGEPCYETDTGKLKIGNGSDYYSNLPYVSDGGTADLPIASSTVLGGVKIGDNLSITEDGVLSASGGSGGTSDYTQLENKPQINSVELTGDKTLDDLGIQAKGDYQPAGDYLKTSQVQTSPNSYYGVYLRNGQLDTVQPKFYTADHGLSTGNIAFINKVSYSETEPSDDEMTEAWTDKSGFFTYGVDTNTGYISGSVKFGAASGSIQVIVKLLKSNIIEGVDQSGSCKFSKFEISSDGTNYTEVTTFDNTWVRYIRFTFDYDFSSITYADFKTRIRVAQSTSAYGASMTTALGVNTDDSTIKVIDNQLVANVPTKTSELTNDSGFLTEVPSNMVTTDTAQTISGSKTFSSKAYLTSGCNFTASTYSSNYFKKGFVIGNVDIYNSTGDIIRMGASSTSFLTFENNILGFYSSSSVPGMKITDGVITAGYSKPYLKIKEYGDSSNTHNLEINCDTANDNIWSIACGDQTFINTANIDTTYMKWDSSNSKLTVDTAAVAHLAMPSSTTVSLTLGASGTSYTAPADGYVHGACSSSSNGLAYMEIANDNISATGTSSLGGWGRVHIPISKDTTFQTYYGGTDFVAQAFQFTYCNGSVPSS